MKANEAKQLTEAAKNAIFEEEKIILNEIYEKIKEAALNRKSEITVYNINEHLQEILKENGYNVEYFDGGFRYDESFWKISW